MFFKRRGVSKYLNIKRVVDGITFDSKKEASRYLELKVLEKAGSICGLELQKRFIVLPAFDKEDCKIYSHPESYKERPVAYIADFYYTIPQKDTSAHKLIAEDVKGFKTDVYKLKKKLFKKAFPNVELRET